MKNKYSDEHLQFIKDNIRNTGKDLVDMFNNNFDIKINVHILGNIKTKLGIKSGLVGGRFEKGHKTFNKGKKWIDYMNVDSQNNCRKTTFKKGNQPHNHRPVGSERITKDGYIQIKVKEPNKWQLKHRFIYEKANGKIPKGTKLIFLDGNRFNFELSNLQIITCEQSLIMNKNHYFTTNKNLTKTGVIVSNLMSKTREKTRH